jgi:DNA-directed RNA polymerase subunit RPC12/RpoP
MKDLNFVCSSCGEPLTEFEIQANLFVQNEDEVECMPCELKMIDGWDIDNFGA